MEAIHYVMAAGIIVWVSIGAYIFCLSKRQRNILARLNQLESMEEGK